MTWDKAGEGPSNRDPTTVPISSPTNSAGEHSLDTRSVQCRRGAEILQQSWGWFTHTFELSSLWVVWILGRYEALSKEGSCLSPLWPGGTVRFESRPGQRPLFSFPFDEGKQECGQAGLHESHHLPLEVLHLYVVGMNLNEVTEEAVSLCILDAL